MRRQQQAPVASLQGFSRYSSRLDCLRLISRELARCGDDFNDKADRLFDALWEPFDEESLALLHEYWLYDWPQLLKRGRNYRKDVPAKPRIDVEVTVTSRANLKVDWFPQGYNNWGRIAGEESDFIYWHRFENRHGGFDSRPSNELMFLRGFGDVHASAVQDRPCAGIWPLLQPLVAASVQAVVELTERLKQHFEVRMLTDIMVRWTDDGQALSWNSAPPRILNVVIEDPEDRRRREEFAELASIEEWLGVTESDLKEAIDTEANRPKRRTGPPSSPHTVLDRVVRLLKTSGAPATKTKVERALFLIEKHRRCAKVVNFQEYAAGRVEGDDVK